MFLKELCCDGLDWTRLAQGRVQRRALVNTDNELLGSIKDSEFRD